MKTATELNMELKEQLRKQELRYWQSLHPNATVKYNKKQDCIEIKYPLPKDFDLISKFIKAL
jgi:hypothetical protein